MCGGRFDLAFRLCTVSGDIVSWSMCGVVSSRPTSTWIPREDFPFTGWSSYLLAVDSCYTESEIWSNFWESIDNKNNKLRSRTHHPPPHPIRPILYPRLKCMDLCGPRLISSLMSVCVYWMAFDVNPTVAHTTSTMYHWGWSRKGVGVGDRDRAGEVEMGNAPFKAYHFSR